MQFHTNCNNAMLNGKVLVHNLSFQQQTINTKQKKNNLKSLFVISIIWWLENRLTMMWFRQCLTDQLKLMCSNGFVNLKPVLVQIYFEVNASFQKTQKKSYNERVSYIFFPHTLKILLSFLITDLPSIQYNVFKSKALLLTSILFVHS